MTETELDKINEQIAEIVRHEVLRTLNYLGNECDKRVRDRSKEESWIDQTGNLRSSVGYAVYDHGQTANVSAFRIVKQGKRGSDLGKSLAESLAKTYAQHYALVIMAGMEYAEYVERRDNKDVLASTKLWATSKIGDYAERTKKRIEKKINALLK